MIYLNVEALKQLKSDVGSFYSRAVQNVDLKAGQF